MRTFSIWVLRCMCWLWGCGLSGAEMPQSKIQRIAASYEFLGLPQATPLSGLSLEAIMADAEKDNPEALHELGRRYAYGLGMKQDMGAAFRHVFTAALKGDPKAQVSASALYASGSGVKQNLDTALLWSSFAAETGDLRGMFNMGLLYLRKEGADSNERLGIAWVQKAAEGGLPSAQSLMGHYRYWREDNEDERNNAEAFRWWALAAAQDDAKGLIMVGAAYLKGIFDRTQNLELATQLLLSAGEQGDNEAHVMLSKLPANGLLSYGPKSPLYADGRNVESYYWALLAVKSRPGVSSDNLASNARRPLKQKEAARAEELARTFKPRGPRPGGAPEVPKSDLVKAPLAAEPLRRPGEAPATAMANDARVTPPAPAVPRSTPVPSMAVPAPEQAADSFNPGASAPTLPAGLLELTEDSQAALSRLSQADLLARAGRAEAEAQYLLGYRHHCGLGAAKDDAVAFQWWLKAAQTGHAEAQRCAAICYGFGVGVEANQTEGVRWMVAAAHSGSPAAMHDTGRLLMLGRLLPRDVKLGMALTEKAAEAGSPQAMASLAAFYTMGGELVGLPEVKADPVKAFKWAEAGAAQEHVLCLYMLGDAYDRGMVVSPDGEKAVKMWRRGAELGGSACQTAMGECYAKGRLVGKDLVEACKWFLLAGLQGDRKAGKMAQDLAATAMTAAEKAEAETRVQAFRLRPRRPIIQTNQSPADPKTGLPGQDPALDAKSYGTGFFITRSGHLVTCQHVVEGARKLALIKGDGTRLKATIVAQDKNSDLAVLQAEGGKHAALAVVIAGSARLGASVATIGYPNLSIQGRSAKLARGEITGLNGWQDHPGFFQISIPVMPGHSGGALYDAKGNVVGIISRRLEEGSALISSGRLAGNIGYAAKSSQLMTLAASVPGLAAQMEVPASTVRPFEDVTASVEQASVLVLVEE